MYGAIIGDIIGSYYELNCTKDYDFQLFSSESKFTDDTVLNLAVCSAILHNCEKTSFTKRGQRVFEYGAQYRKYYNRYPNAGFGQMFSKWAKGSSFERQRSYGNGAAMRVIPIGYAYSTLEQVLLQAKLSAKSTHNHPEAIKGAQAVAAGVYLARQGQDKEMIRNYIGNKFSYDLSYNLDSIKDGYVFNSRTSYSVPVSILCFLESSSYEDAVRNAVSLGGDADTMACIAGGIAEAFGYKVPNDILSKGKHYLDMEQKNVINEFNKRYL